jgi:membrane protease YdiL (CAAX protease family)
MADRAKSIPWWFIAAITVMGISQIARLYQTTPEGWIACDYAGRIGALLLLAFIPAARAVAYRREALRVSWWETVLWIVGIVVLFPSLAPILNHQITLLISHTRIGHYYPPTGWLNIVDLTFGLALTAYHEEIIFRRCARAVFSPQWGKGVAMVLLTSLLFAAYHWTTGIGNMVPVFFFGIYMMLFLRRTGALWPLVIAHFLTDFVQFSGLRDYIAWCLTGD